MREYKIRVVKDDWDPGLWWLIFAMALFYGEPDLIDSLIHFFMSF